MATLERLHDSPESSSSSSSGGSGQEDPENLQAWTEFLTAYANGTGVSVSTRPPLPAHLQKRLDNLQSSETPWPFIDTPLYSSVIITPHIAGIIREYYCDHGYLPPPRAPLEAERNQCIRDYDLYSTKQQTNIQMATDLIAAVFPDTLTTFSLFQDRVQTHFALSGPRELIDQYELTVGLQIPAEYSLCGHAVLLDREMLFVPDLQADWRYKYNPFAMAGFKSFVGSPVSLELDPSSQGPRNRTSTSHTSNGDAASPIRVGIGTLNICFVKQPHRALTDAEKLVIDRITSMLEVQLRGSWEGDQRRRYGRARLALSDFIEESLVKNAGQVHDTLDGSDVSEDPMGGGRVTMQQLAQIAIDKITSIVVEAGSISIWDVRAFTRRSGPAQYVDFENYPLRPIASKEVSEPTPSSLPPDALAKILSSTVQVFTPAHPSGLESALPSNTTGHLALSFSDADEPVYLFLVTSSHEHYHFPADDVNFIRNIGSILLARSVQARVVKADAAKTSFLSAISHELRTPMHAVMQSHGLMRQALESQEYGDLGSILALSESSSMTLTNILNDVLDYGKGTAGDHAEKHQRPVPDLADMTVQLVKMTKTQYLDDSVPVELFVEWEDRNWGVNVDQARFQRVLMNGLTNAMKFCRKGSITVRLTSRSESVVIEVIDTGIGFDEAMMPRVLQAFTKLDKHSAGAGLGLHITKTMLERAGGSLRLKSKLGKGTTFEAVLPVSFAHGSSVVNGHQPVLVRKNLAEAADSRKGLSNGHANGHVDTPTGQNGHVGAKHTASPPISDRPVSRPTPRRYASAGDRPLRILVVDDNIVCRKLLARTLRQNGPNLEVQEAEDGEKALKVFGDWAPNLVFTDVCMPIMDGIVSAGKMREREKSNSAGSPKSQIYALTALGNTDQRSISLAMNGSASLDGWLIKGDDLTQAVSSIVERMTSPQSSTNAQDRETSTTT